MASAELRQLVGYHCRLAEASTSGASLPPGPSRQPCYEAAHSYWPGSFRDCKLQRRSVVVAVGRDHFAPCTEWQSRLAGSGGAVDGLSLGPPSIRPSSQREKRRHSLVCCSLANSSVSSEGWNSIEHDVRDGRRPGAMVVEGIIVSPLADLSDTPWLGLSDLSSEVYDSDGLLGVGGELEESDSVLAPFKVQSAEEQEELARTPAHPLALKGMFASYVANCLVERSFRFAIPAVIACLHESLVPVAVMQFVGQLAIFALGPNVGDYMDSAPRVAAMHALTFVQTTSMIVSAAVTVLALRSGASLAATAGELVTKPWFVLVTLTSVLERLTGVASGVAFERDWVVQLAGPSRPLALAEANSVLRRFDLLCEVVGPCAFGWLLSRTSPAFALTAATAAVAAFLPIQVWLVNWTNKLSNGALQRTRPNQRLSFASPSPVPLPSLSPARLISAVRSALSTMRQGWRLYLQQPVLSASVAYVLLFFNAVLSPGGLMTSFLTQQGLDPQVIGVFRGACAVVGFLGTYASTELIRCVGVLKAGAAALVFQATSLALAVLVYMTMPVVGASRAMLAFLTFIVVSRLGLWTYDVVDTQIFQTSVPAADSNVVSTTEMSLASLAELVMLAVAMAADDPRHFGTLAALSMASVAGAAAVYCRWLLQGTPEQKRLELACMGHAKYEEGYEIEGALA